jgi:hypothetical protein
MRPVLVPEIPAPILVPIPRHPTEVGAVIISNRFVSRNRRICDQGMFLD